jgi:PncC family amidohydrolase
MLDAARARGVTLATAESCTGGMVAAELTAVPGSSDVFLGGAVTYSNQLKHDVVGVPDDLVERYGAVSAEVAAAMADGARDRLGSDVAVGVTGIAGPGGGSEHKPVGLVHVHVSGLGRDTPLQMQWGGRRADIRLRATVASLHALLDHLASES